MHLIRGAAGHSGHRPSGDSGDCGATSHARQPASGIIRVRWSQRPVSCRLLRSRRMPLEATSLMLSLATWRSLSRRSYARTAWSAAARSAQHPAGSIWRTGAFAYEAGQADCPNTGVVVGASDSLGRQGDQIQVISAVW